MMRRLQFLFFVALLGWGILMGLLLKLDLDNKSLTEISKKYPDRGVSVININLNGVSLDEVNNGPKDTKYYDNELMVINDGKIDEYDEVEIKGRGNVTWTQEKKPYQIKFENKVDLFGMGKARKWYLLANAKDATNLRTEAAFYLEEMLGMDCAYKGEFVELYVDGGYRGLYYLTRAVEISKDLVDLRDPMGVLVELDNIYGWTEEYNYKTNNGDTLVVKDVVAEDYEKVAMEGFLRDYDEFEVAVAEGDYEKVTELVDVESFAKYFLLSEFTVNPDAYWTSFYMYKDGVNDKIHAGPGWDFDLTFGNRRWGNWMGEKFYSPTETMVRRGELLTLEEYDDIGLMGGEMDWSSWSSSLSRIMFDLMEMSEFREEVEKVYRERMAGRETELVRKIRVEAEKIAEVMRMNGERWGEEGYWGEFETMVDWAEKRYEFFEQEYSSGVDEAIAQ